MSLKCYTLNLSPLKKNFTILNLLNRLLWMNGAFFVGTTVMNTDYSKNLKEIGSGWDDLSKH